MLYQSQFVDKIIIACKGKVLINTTCHMCQDPRESISGFLFYFAGSNGLESDTSFKI